MCGLCGHNFRHKVAYIAFGQPHIVSVMQKKKMWFSNGNETEPATNKKCHFCLVTAILVARTIKIYSRHDVANNMFIYSLSVEQKEINFINESAAYATKPTRLKRNEEEEKQTNNNFGSRHKKLNSFVIYKNEEEGGGKKMKKTILMNK